MKTIFLENHSLFFSISLVIFLFFFIFGLPTPAGSLTPILTISVIFFAILNCKKYFLYIPKPIFYLFLFLFFDLLVCLAIPCILGTYDFSIIQTKINFIASLLATYVFSIFLISNNLSEKSFFNLLLSVFTLQIILVLTMLVNSDISQMITSFTRSGDQGMRVLESYSGARGLGVADSSAFGFAIVMGLFVFLSFFSYKNKYIDFKYFTILILLGGIASVSAGRTAILGLIFGLVYFFVNFTNIRTFFTLISTFFIIVLSGFFLLSVGRESIENDTLGYFYSYSMEPILSYIDTGSFSSTSTDALQNMYFPLTDHQYLIGDGRYMDGSSYYMATDAGYMRFALFYGSFFSLLLYGFFSYFVSKVAILNKKNIVFFVFIWFFSLALHYKGEVVLFSISYNKVLFFILFYTYMKNFDFNRKLLQ